MKSCPACNRTFDDTMTFCLVDGSVLSAPFDLNAARQTPASRNTEPAQTEMLSPVPLTASPTRPAQSDKAPTPLPQTIASPAPVPSPQNQPSASLTLDDSSNEAALPQPAMMTMKAPPPEMISQGAAFVAQTPPDCQPVQTQAAGGKRLAVIVGSLLLVIAIVGIVWFIRISTPKQSPSTAPSQQAKQTEIKPTPTGQSFTENINEIPILMVSVAGGTFLMGSPLAEAGRDNDEGPQNETTVQNFDMSKYEVTQAQYRAVMGTNPSRFKGDDLPVDSVSWNDAIEFCRKLSQLTGREYRLPTEAEWEYACRAGTSGPYAGKIDTMTWYDTNSGNQTHPVGQKQPNGFGLYDMYGNVWEWCQSKYKPYPYNATDGREALQETDVRVLRGGSWESSANSCRSSYRRRVIPDLRSVGFRVALAAR